jgi:hypothetical protein
MTERTQSELPGARPQFPPGAGAGDDAGGFQFDRPAERGLAPRTYGEGALTGAEACEAAADRLRDALLANYDPAEELARMLEAGQAPPR